MEQFYYFDITWQNEDNQPERTKGFVTACTLSAAVEKLEEDYELIQDMTIKTASEFRTMDIDTMIKFFETLLPENRLEEICGTQVQIVLENLRAIEGED